MVINKGMAALYDAVFLYSTSNTLHCIILWCYICTTVHSVSEKSDKDICWQATDVITKGTVETVGSWVTGSAVVQTPKSTQSDKVEILRLKDFSGQS